MKSDIHDIEVIFEWETEKAFKVRKDETSEAIWIPKSQCELSGDDANRVRGAVYTLTSDQKTLEEKGLV